MNVEDHDDRSQHVDDPAERLDVAVAALTASLLSNETQQRTMLRLSLEEDKEVRGPLPLRQGRAIAWLTEALAPLADEMSDAQLHRLVLAIRSAVGIEALVWLTDVAGLSSEDAVELMRWSASALLRTALDHAPP